MMRGPRFFAVACRRLNKEIIVQQESVASGFRGLKVFKLPLLRGMLALVDSIMLGMKSLMFSANVAMDDLAEVDPKNQEKKAKELKAAELAEALGIEEPAPADKKKSKTRQQSVNDIAVSATMVLGLGLGVGLFFVTPQLLVGLLESRVPNPTHLNIIAGVVKFAIFIGYILAISRMKDIQRVFQYHGAEHKVINTYEAGLDLTPENISKYGTIHPRCGTSFLLIVLTISIIVFCFLGWSTVWYERILSRLVLLPLIAGLAYEVIRFAGKHRESAVMRVITAPGMWMQRMTTRPPTDDQVEVALKALQAVIEKENEAPVVEEPVAAK